MGSRMLVALSVALLASVCSPVPTPEPPPPTSGDCFDAQQRLEYLSCLREDGSPWWRTPGGTPFGVACERARADGRDWHPECIAQLTDCAYLTAAFEGRQCQPSN